MGVLDRHERAASLLDSLGRGGRQYLTGVRVQMVQKVMMDEQF